MATAAPSEAAASKHINFREVLPKIGLVHSEHTTNWILCKPKIMPLKSFTLQKMETLQKQAQETVLQLNRDFPTQNMTSGGGKRHLDTPAPLEEPDNAL